MNTFDYVFYRIYKFYIGQGSSVTHTYSSALVSLAQFMSVMTVTFLAALIIGHEITLSKWSFAPLFLLFMVINWYRYERNFDIKKYEERFGTEPVSERKKKGWMIVLWFTVVILVPVGIGVLQHNLGLI